MYDLIVYDELTKCFTVEFTPQAFLQSDLDMFFA